MLIHVNSDANVKGSEELTRHVDAVLSSALRRFDPQITRVEVHLSDVNSRRKSGGDDKRCALEARLAGLQPIGVSHQAPSLDRALRGAADKLQRALDRAIGRLSDRRGSIRSTAEAGAAND